MTKKEDEGKSKGEHEFHDNALSARRRALRPSLAKPPVSSEEGQVQQSEHIVNEENTTERSLGQVIENIGKHISDKQVPNSTESVLLRHIEQALNLCAGHLASLQNVASKQVEELKVIAETLQSRTPHDLGQSLAPLVESLSAAIEPMKAIGELVPALDRLANATEGKDQSLHAMQYLPSNDAPSVNSDSIKQQQFEFDEQVKQEFLQKEEELSRKLAEKELEIESIREQLDSQWQGLLTQCEELKMTVQNREEILQGKDTELNKKISELSAKDSENQQLKAQIAELKDKTKEMMTDMQKQLAKKQEEEITRKQQDDDTKKEVEEKARLAKASTIPQSGFFDFVSTGNANNTLFTANPSSLLPPDQSEVETVESPVVRNEEAPNIAQVVPANRSPLNAPAPALSSDVQAAQNAASFVSAVGSYGSGVRAQVFEVIVRQALAGTKWREICAVPMQSNNISPQEVEAEVKRRQDLLNK